jgi:DNA repair exonuclease SbcCD ATPase subunit
LALADDERREERETPLEPELRVGLGRIFTFARLVRDLLEKSAPEEVSFAGLRTTQTNLQQAYAELAAFFTNANQAHLTNALNSLDAATTSYSWTFYNRPVRGAKPQFENVESVRKAAEKAIAAIQKSVSAFNDSLSTTSAQLQSQNDRIEQLSGALDEVRGNSSAAVASIQQQFSETQSAFRNELDALKKSFQTQREELITDFSSDAEAVIKELEAQKEKAAKIVQVVGNIGVTGNYQALADNENAAADRWRQITLGFFTVGILLVSAVLLHHLFGQETSGLDSLVVRFALAAVVTLPALYAAGESSRHRRVAEQARRTELQLASLSPFLSTLPQDKQNEILEELAPTYFVGSPEQSTQAPAKDEGFDLTKILGEIANIISRAKA